MNIELLGFKFLSLVRAFFYLYLTIESSFLAFLYLNAYKKYKTTPIIKAVQILLFSISINFFYMTIVSLISFIDRGNPLYDIFIAFIPVFTVPLIYGLINFRERSTEEVAKDGKHLVKSYKLKK